MEPISFKNDNPIKYMDQSTILKDIEYHKACRDKYNSVLNEGNKIKMNTLDKFLISNNIEDIENYEKVFAFINKFKNFTSKRTHLYNIIQMCSNKEQYSSLYKETNQLTHMITNHKKIDKELIYETWDDIIAKRDMLPTYTNEYLLLCFYTMLPPLSNIDIFSIVLVSDSHPYDRLYTYNLSTHKLTLDKRNITVSPDLALAITEYLKNKTIDYGDILFPYNNSKQITRVLTKIFNHKINSSIIRKVFINTFVSSLSPEEKKTLSYIMNHRPTNKFLEYYKEISVTTNNLSKYMNISLMI